MVRVGIRLYSFERFATAIVVLIAWIALPTSLVFAQTSTATIVGTVKDTSGALIPGAMITVKHIDTGLHANRYKQRERRLQCAVAPSGRV